MNTRIEIHDSTVAEIVSQDGTVCVHFQPAYLHKSEGRAGWDAGTEWVQEARLIFSEGVVGGDFPKWPCDMSDGELRVESERHDNSIPIPFKTSLPAELRLTCISGQMLTITGRGARLELIGEPKYVEEFPDFE